MSPVEEEQGALRVLEEDRARLRPFLDDLWRWKCGLPPKEGGDFESFAREQWSAEFERLMRNRLILGGLRYGGLGVPGKPNYDCVGAIEKRVGNYRKDGNLEWLVDVANLALLEYVEGKHPLRHFRPGGVDEDDRGEHVQVVGE